MAYKWMPIMGKMKQDENIITFNGEPSDSSGIEVGNTIGLFIYDQTFSGGTISATVSFDSTFERSCCDLVLFYDSQNKWTLNAGITSDNLFAIRHFDGKWTNHAVAGGTGILEIGKQYNLKATMKGSLIVLFVDDVEVLKFNLPFALPQSQVGIFTINEDTVHINDFTIHHEKPRAFVVMEYSAPYNEVYYEVIKTVCDEEGLDVHRIDEAKGPGLIISDINNAILDAKVIIADISAHNPNVFYEVGYSHAFNKPTILIAEKDTKLPFDVSPFRTLFYENSIAGKRQLEEGLRKHIKASLTERRS